MPKYKVTNPDYGRSIVFTGDSPPTEGEVAAAFRQAFGKPSTGLSGAKPDTSVKDEFMGASALERFNVGMGKGFYDVGTGLKQIGLQAGEAVGIVPEGRALDYTRKVQSENELYEGYAGGSNLAGLGRLVGGTLPTLPVPGGVAGGVARRAGTAALAGGLVGASQFVPEGESRLGNAALGAVTGGGVSGALSGVGKGINAIAGKSPKSDIAMLGERFNIPTTLGEDITSPGLQGTETLLERVPLVGLKNFRIKQQEAADKAAKTFLSKYIADPSAVDPAVANAEFIDNAYNAIRTVTKDNPVMGAASQTRKAASELTERYPDVFNSIQDTHIKRIVNNVLEDASSIKDAKGNPIRGAGAPEFDFDTLWMLRKGIGRQLGNTKGDKIAHAELSKLYSAVSGDIDNILAKTDPKASQMFRDANEAYKTYEIKYNKLQEAYDKAAGTVGAGEMFSPKRFSTALKKVAYDNKKRPIFDVREINEMTGLANILQVVKRGGQYMENPPTGNRMLGPATIGTGGAIGYYGGLAATAKAAGAVGASALVVRFLTTTKAGKNLVMAASKIEPNSPKMAALMRQVYNQASKMAAVKATQNTPEPYSETQ